MMPSLAHAATPQVRVALVREASELRLMGRNFYCFLPNTPEAEQVRLPRQTAQIRHTGAGFVITDNQPHSGVEGGSRAALPRGGATRTPEIGDQFIQAPALDCISGEGILSVNAIPVQGHLILFAQGPQKLGAVLTLPLEQYLIGVLQGEVSEGWPAEALKAQAIAARSYTLATMRHRSGQPYDVLPTTRDQVYTARVRIPTPIQAAVLATQGQVLQYQDRTLRAFYHSCCGGRPESLTAVWQDLAPGKAAPPFPSAPAQDPFCRKAPHYRWTLKLPGAELVQSLQTLSPQLTSPSQLEFVTADNGRVASVGLPGARPVTLSGNQFRKALGYDTVKSTRFTVRQRGHIMTLRGQGHGHGVGLCQWGAKGMADRGKTADEILQFYYPGTEIKKVY